MIRLYFIVKRITIVLVLAMTVHLFLPVKQTPAHEHWNTALVGRWGGGPSMNLFKDGDRIYYGMGAYLKIVDASNPSAIAPMSELLLEGLVRGMDKYLNYLYVSTEKGGVRIIDISDPYSPTEVGSIDTPSSSDVLISGTRAYIGTQYGVYIYDLTNPTSPVLLGSYTNSGSASELELVGNLLYVASGMTAVYILDVSNPSSISKLDSYAVQQSAMDILVSGNYAFVADAGAGLKVLDISDPNNITFAGYYYTSCSASYLFQVDTLLYVSEGCGLEVFDISDPTDPQLSGSHLANCESYELIVDGGNIFMVDGYCGFKVFEISISVPAPGNGSLNLGKATVNFTLLFSISAYDEASNCALSGNYAYLTTSKAGFAILDVSDPENPTLLGSATTANNARDIAVSGNYAYIAVNVSGLSVFNISNPAAPAFVTRKNTLGSAFGVEIAGGYIYIANGSQGLFVMDISNPEDPSFASSYALDGFARDICIQGNYAYIADGYGGLRIMDISDPLSPTLKGTLTTGNAWSVDVYDNYAYIADYSSGLVIADVSDPANPQVVGTSNESKSAQGVATDGNTAFVADGSNGLLVFDVSDPSSPTLKGYYRTNQSAQKAKLSGDNVFVADGDDGLYIIEYSQDTAVLITSFTAELTSDNTAVRLSWDLATDENFRSVRVLRAIENRNSPVEPVCISGTLPPHTKTWTDSEIEYGRTYNYSIEVLGEKAIYISYEVAVKIPCSRLSLEQNFPNPFNPSTSIRFLLPSEEWVSLKIYSSSGRLVRKLYQGVLSSGQHTIRWDGKDNNGKEMPSGVYLYKLQTKKRTLSKKMILIR